ncbi:glycosyltransferase family 4 protein [Parasphingorhabdus pacifica]
MHNSEPHVLVDATAVPADRGGVGRYVDSLLAALDQDGASVTVVCQPRDTDLFSRIAPRTEVLPTAETVTTRTARLTWEQTTLPRLVRRHGIDVLHSPHYTTPLANPAASVVTLHDATFFSDAPLHSPVKAKFFRAWTRTALRRATLCVVPSEATANELVRTVGAERQSMHVMYHGVDPDRFHPPTPEEEDEVRSRLSLHTQPYIAFLGALEPRKNVPALIRGFAMTCGGRRDAPALVLAGQSGWDAEIDRALEAVPHRTRVIRTGYLPFSLLPGFLGGAQVVAYPSFGEGFGLPVLEAMACGAAVLTSRRLSLPEVGGEAVAYTGVGAGDIGIGLSGLLDAPDRRAALSAAAQRRAKEFTWAACAAQHRESYARAHHRHRRAR